MTSAFSPQKVIERGRVVVSRLTTSIAYTLPLSLRKLCGVRGRLPHRGIGEQEPEPGCFSKIDTRKYSRTETEKLRLIGVQPGNFHSFRIRKQWNADSSLDRDRPSLSPIRFSISIAGRICA
ncbi:hypothetical protein [Coleofasciculus sp. H7-2]|uniref:hypothetical protein n=1 Tax=Coleofasciculus sp. H7-2 TaxID=3351545 RepID=UPI00366E6DDE